MTNDEFRAIRATVDRFSICQAEIEFCERQQKMLESHRDPLTIGFVGNSGTVSIPEPMQQDLRDWLHVRFFQQQQELQTIQRHLTCPAGSRIE